MTAIGMRLAPLIVVSLSATCCRPADPAAVPPAVVASAARPGQAAPEAAALPSRSASPSSPQAWSLALLGLPLRSSGDADAGVVGEVPFGEAVEISPATAADASMVRVRSGRLEGWVPRTCLRFDPLPPVDASRLGVLTGFVRAALAGAPLEPYLTPRVTVHVDYSDRSHGSGSAEAEVAAAACAPPITIRVPVDGQGWAAVTSPHGVDVVVELRADLSTLLGEQCAADVSGRGLTLASLSGYLTLRAELVDTPDGPRIGRITKQIADPG